MLQFVPMLFLPHTSAGKRRQATRSRLRRMRYGAFQPPTLKLAIRQPRSQYVENQLYEQVIEVRRTM
jgi:hypothetical protein